MKRSITIVFIFLSILTTAQAHAENDQERAALTYFLNELNALDRMINEAERYANPDNRHTFDYLAIREDLQKIKEGVSDYLNTARRDPRQLPPLDGEYKN